MPHRTRLPRRIPSGLGALRALLVTVALLACRRHRSDEEILRERLDVTPVHLYVASRFALTAPESNPHASVVRRDLGTLVRATDDVLARRDAGAQGATEYVLTLDESTRLVMSLVHLRSEARRLLREAPERDMPPVIPALLGARLMPEQCSIWTRDTEHALLLAALFVLKFDAREPVPVPVELVLYEAWMARPDRLPGLEPFVHALKAAVFGLNDLCDLAATEAASPALEGPVGAHAAAARTLDQIAGRSLAFNERHYALSTAASRALAHGASAVCFYFSRHDRARGLAELRRFVEAAHAAGVAPVKTATLRAWIAYEDGDLTAARACLVEARNDPEASEATRRDLDQLLRDFSLHNNSAVGRYYDKAHFTALVARMLVDSLARSGAFDGLEQSDVGRAIRGYGATVSSVVERARGSVPSLDRVTAPPRSILDRLRR